MGLCVESGVIAEGSVLGFLDGRSYDRGVRLHNIMYEGLMRLAWQTLGGWIKEIPRNPRLLLIASSVRLASCMTISVKHSLGST